MAEDVRRGAGPDAAQGRGLACPRCAASVRPGAPWCTQCYLELRTPPLPAAAPLPVPVPAVVPVTLPAPAPAPVPVVAPEGERGWPCGTCGHRNPLEAAACTACGAGFLAELRADEPPLLVLPGVGDLTRLGRSARTGGAFGVVLVLLLLVLLVAWSTS